MAPSAAAQAIYGNVYGTVTDPAGAAVPGAKVTVTDVGKGSVTSATTNESGSFRVTHLIPGTYDVRFEGQGFKATENKGVRVFADQSVKLDAAFQIGQASETIEVSADNVPVIKTDKADVATTFTERQVTELPLINRNFTELQLLTPGTQTLTWQHAAAENPQSSTQIFVNGQHFSGTSFQLDGTDNRDPILGIIVVNPNMESVTETKIATQNYDAEFGQAIAAVVTAQTKSGSNAVHGAAFWFRRNDQMQAKDPFISPNPITGRSIAESLRNQFGGAIGGPIVKNKLFFFGDYQGLREKVGRATRLNVPTALVRSTCLSSTSAICDMSEYLAVGGQVYDPATGDPLTGAGRTAFAGNIIPRNRLSPSAVSLLSLLPAPFTGDLTENYTAIGTGGYNGDNFDVRIDNNWSDRLQIFGRYSLQDYELAGRSAFDTDTVAAGGRGLGLNGFAGQSNTRNHSVASGFNYMVSPSLLTDFRFGYFKYRVAVLPNGVGTSPATDAGIPGLNVDDFYTSGMPAFFINGGGGRGGDIEFGYALSDRLNRCNCPLDQNEDQFQFVNNWTNIRGSHTIKFGADIRYARNLRVPSDAHRAGELSFENAGTSNAGVGGAALATYLLGEVTSMRRFVSTQTDAGERQRRWFFYGQDTWRATNKLMLNFGLRWEIYFPQKVTGPEKGGFLDLATGEILVAGVGDIATNFGVENSLKNFAPRLGLTYEISDKTVLRMGYGRSFDIGVFGSTFGHSVTQNLPVLAVQEERGPNSNIGAFTLASGPPAPVFPDVPSSGRFPLPDGIFQRALRTRMQLPTVDAWNITLQQELTSNMSAEVAYVGNKGTHVFAGSGPAYNINQATIAGFTPGRNTNAAKLFYDEYGWTQGIDYFGNDASNNYHGLQTKVERRMADGFQFMAHYTWSRAMNFDGDYYPIDPEVNYGRNDMNRTHVFVFTNLWELPFGRGKAFMNDNAVANAILGGWQINTVTNWSSGLPFSPSYSDCGRERDTGPCRPNLVGDVSYGDRDRWFTVAPASLANPGDTGGPWQRPEVGQFGDAERNALVGPSFFNTDLSLFKNISISERVRAQLRFEAFNVFNRVNLGTPGIFFTQYGFGGSNCVDCSDGGVIKAAGGPMRQLQLGVRVQF